MLDFAKNEKMKECFAAMLLHVFLFHKINKMNTTKTRFGCWTFFTLQFKLFATTSGERPEIMVNLEAHK